MSDTDGPTELREALDRAIETRDTAITELREFKAGVLFKDAGLAPKHAELFLKTSPDAEVTAETAKAFAEEYSLLPAPASESKPEPAPIQGEPAPVTEEKPLGVVPATPVAPVDSGMAALSGAAGSATEGAQPAAVAKMSADAFTKLLETNPIEAAKAYTEGRVERNSLNVQADQLVQKGIIAH